MKKNIWMLAVVYIVVACALAGAMYQFQKFVRERLWNLAVEDIMEVTKQGTMTLRVQMDSAHDTLNNFAEVLEEVDDYSNINEILIHYNKVEDGVMLYLDDYTVMPYDMEPDSSFAGMAAGDTEGIMAPHVRSGSNGTANAADYADKVMDVYVSCKLADGRRGYLTKEFRIDDIIDTFSLSYYGGKGFSYIADSNGTVLIPPADKRDIPDSIACCGYLKALPENSMTGWTILNDIFYCYMPIGVGSDWHLVSVVDMELITREADQIVSQTYALLAVVIMTIVVIMIITMRRTLKASRDAENQNLYTEHIFNNVPEGIALTTINAPYINIRMNYAGYQMFGYDNDSKNNMCIDHFVYNEDYDHVTGVFDEAAQGRGPCTYECRIRRADGILIWIAGIVERNHDNNGNDILMTTFHDITEEKLAREEEAVKNKRERRMLITAVTESYSIIASLNITSDELQFISLRELFADSVSRAGTYNELYERIAERIEPKYEDEFRQRFAPDKVELSFAKGRSRIWTDIRLRLDDGIYHWLSIQIIHVCNRNNSKEINAVFLARISDEQKIEEANQKRNLQDALSAAKLANEAKSRFLSNMSHDIRTPLNSIMGMTDILKSHPDDTKQVEEGLDKISMSGRHLLELINDILDMSRIESGKMSLQESGFNIRAMMSELIELVRPQALGSGITFVSDIVSIEHDNVIGDELRIKQIYLNILSNAVKYTWAGGSITITLREDGDVKNGRRHSYIFICSDNGIGMSREFQKHIFDSFERAEDNTIGNVTGTGLGMAIARNLVNLMGGTIDVDSRLGKGSVFTVTIPLEVCDVSADNKAADESAATMAPSGEHAAAEDESVFKHGRVLLVEDNELNRDIAAILIGEMGVDVETAANGREAVAKVEGAEEGYYDVILMDIKMPVMNGYDAVKNIRALERDDVKTLPIIAMTANAFSEDVHKALKAGMNAHLSKPIEVAKLKRMLGKYIDIH